MLAKGGFEVALAHFVGQISDERSLLHGFLPSRPRSRNSNTTPAQHRLAVEKPEYCVSPESTLTRSPGEDNERSGQLGLALGTKTRIIRGR